MSIFVHDAGKEPITLVIVAVPSASYNCILHFSGSGSGSEPLLLLDELLELLLPLSLDSQSGHVPFHVIVNVLFSGSTTVCTDPSFTVLYVTVTLVIPSLAISGSTQSIHLFSSP